MAVISVEKYYTIRYHILVNFYLTEFLFGINLALTRFGALKVEGCLLFVGRFALVSVAI